MTVQNHLAPAKLSEVFVPQSPAKGSACHAGRTVTLKFRDRKGELIHSAPFFHFNTLVQ